MPNDINEMKKFVNNVKKLVEKKVNNAKTDTSKKAIVQSLNEDGTANIIINGEVYNNVKIRAGLQPQINEVVLVSIPNNNTKDMFIDLASSTSTSGGETNHTHSNLSILETITQALIDAWNSAVAHISDAIKHITSDERNLWNTVVNKVDKIEGKGLSTEDYTTEEKNKLAGIASGAEVNQNAFSNIKVGSSTISADSKTDTLEIAAGTGITITTDTINDKITINGVNQYTHPNHTGDVTSIGDGVTTISNNVVTNAKLADMASNTVKGRKSSGTGDPEDISISDLKSMLALNNVTNETQIPLSQKGVANGVAELDASGKVPSSQLPSYVDDVLEYVNLSSFPTTGETGKIYIAQDTNKTYRWSGGAYVEISASLALGETSSTAYRGDRGKVAYDHSQSLHAPVDAQKNSDITKAEIEAKLTGTISTHSHTLAGLSEKNYSSLVGRPADDDFHTLTALLDSANDDELVIYDVSDSSYKKITRENLLAGLLSSSQFVFIRKKEEFTATEGQTVFNLTQGSYEVGTGRIDVYIWGNKQPPSAYTETSSTNITLANGVEAGTKVLIEYIQIANVMDYIHAQNHKIGGSDPLTPADIGASAIGHNHVSTEILDFTEAVQDAVGVALTDTSTIDFTYDDTNNQIKADVKPNSSNQKVAISKNSVTPTGTRKQINFKDGTNISISVADNATNDAVDVTITNTYTHPTGDGNLHVPATGTTNNNKVLKAGSTAGSLSWGNVDWSELTNKPSSSVSSIDNAVTNSHTHSNKALLDSYTQTEANLADAVSKKHAQNTDNTLTSSSSNTINTTGTENIVDFKVNNTTKSSIDNNGNFTGKSASADKLATARTITLTGDVTGSASFDGSANISISAAVADDSHNHVISNIDNLQTTLDSKAPLVSPAFTGTPTAPTAPNGTNTDQIATTKFVQNALSAGGYGDMLKSQYDTNNNGIVDRAETADKLTTAKTISLSGGVTGSTSFDGSSNISINATVVDDSHTHDSRYYTESEIQNSDISMRRLLVNANGVPTTNLGNPTIAEMALFEEQFNNKIEFYDISKITFQTSTDGIVWSDFAVSDTVKANFVGGDVGTVIAIPNGTVYFRITVRATSYVYLNSLYMYWSSGGHYTKVQIYKKHDSGSYTQHTSSTTLVRAWPGHLYLPFNTIPFHPNGTLGTHYHEVYIVFIPTWNTSYPSNNITLRKFQLWGGYPAGKRRLYSVDAYKNVTFPASVTATAFNGDLSGRINGIKITAGTTAPSSPQVNDIWIDLS
jgi:hypothetical protein